MPGREQRVNVPVLYLLLPCSPPGWASTGTTSRKSKIGVDHAHTGWLPGPQRSRVENGSGGETGDPSLGSFQPHHTQKTPPW